MRIGRITIASVMLVGILVCFSTTGYAQGSNLGTIRGTVTDSNGAVLPNAAVQVTDQATGLSRSLTTNGEGDYEAVALKPAPIRFPCLQRASKPAASTLWLVALTPFAPI